MTRPTSRYHHGNLRAALTEAGYELARAGGPDAVVVREASRRVGVSHNAAYRHFPTRDDLLRAVGERGMAELAHLMETLVEAAEADCGTQAGQLEIARARLSATGRAYVSFALSEPGLFRTAFAVPESLPHFGPDEGVGDTGLGPYALLNRELDRLRDAGGLADTTREWADVVAWSAVHGLSMLLLDGPLRELPLEHRAAALERLLATIEAGFSAGARTAASPPES